MSLPLKDLRALAGLTQKRLAERAGVSTGLIGQIEVASQGARRSLKSETARAIADALSIGIDDIEWPVPVSEEARGVKPGQKIAGHRLETAPACCPRCFMQLPTNGICDNH